VLMACSLGCGTHPAPDPAPVSLKEPSRPETPASHVVLKGRVVYPADRQVPKQKAIKVPSDLEHCARSGSLLDEGLVVHPENRGVRNVVVWLRPDDANDPNAKFAPNELPPGDATREPKDVVITTAGCRYVPHVLTARVGDIVVVRNSDPIAHNYFAGGSQLERGATFPPRQGDWRFPEPLVTEATPILFKCTIHPWMRGYLRVFEHPFHAVTGEGGSFTIPQAPVGRYRVVYWHEQVGLRDGKIGRFGAPVAIVDGGSGEMEMPPVSWDVTGR